ncbi:acyltransferase family protein [Streptococcus dentiloxodontae]
MKKRVSKNTQFLGTASRKKDYITGLDGLRAIGLLAVLLYHLFPQELKGGYLGVTLFFVLSGYLITDLLAQEFDKNRRIDIKAFYVRRIKRLFPLMFAVLVLTALYLYFFQPNMLNQMRMTFIAACLSFYNWWQIVKGGSYFAQMVAEAPFKHLYSLAIEAQFYLIWPWVMAMVLRLTRHKREPAFLMGIGAILSALLMALLYQSGQDPTRVYYGTDTRVFSLLLGAMTAVLFPSQRLRTLVLTKKQKRLLNLQGVMLLLIIVELLFFLPDQNWLTYKGGMFFFSLISALGIVWAAIPNLGIERFLSNPLLSYLGQRSYALYLWQLPVFSLFPLKASHLSSVWSILCQLAILLIISELSYRLIETPFRRLKWTELRNRLKCFLKSPASFKNAGKILSSYTLILIVLIGLFVIITAPDKTEAQNTIKKQIEMNEQKMETLPSAPVSPEVQTIVDKYGLAANQVEAAQNDKVAIVGDSIISMTYNNLRELFPNAYIDGVIGRSGEHGPDFIAETLTNYPEAQKVVISLGINTDGSQILTSETVSTMMNELGDRQVYWVNVNLTQSQYYWTDQVNQVLSQAAAAYPNLHIVDWYSASINQETSLLTEDRVHPNDQGAIVYGRTLVNTMYLAQ